ncbi:hypothetical protein [Phormidium tenue]|uniref:Uncharacterized protein n=1 Tax=Phormidium tenue NIES-30 TaxID=549789 RepID=A0A1U7IYA5_9CYAN|nr:hypothetical protein [Phormidium tenue]MBD2234927.1 hypothetical protein [Phormidium tenue FACHB-1052]OKH43466.1 hypothetical protein NIES30_24970 [Phormidium tenue NIES-30]
MTKGDKAKGATVAIGPLAIAGFQMPEGSYRMSITSAAEAVGTAQQNGSNFLRLNAFKALQVSSYTPQTSDPGKAYAEHDVLHKQVAQLEQQLHDAGLEP